MCWAGLAGKSGEKTFFPTLMKVLAGGLLSPGHGRGGERTVGGGSPRLFWEMVGGGASVSEAMMPI